MTEVDFAKEFIQLLSARPIRIPADYVEDARKLPARPPTTLSKLPKPMNKRQKTSPSSPTHPPSATITLKTLRPPHSINETHSLPLTTTFAYVKQQLSSDTSVPFDKLRFLHKGKIVNDSKTVGDVTDGGKEVDAVINVMLMGGAVVVRREKVEEEKKEGEGEVKDVEMKEEGVVEEEAKTESKEDDVMSQEEFWSELRGFLGGKLGSGDDAAAVDNVLYCFRSAWESRKAAP